MKCAIEELLKTSPANEKVKSIPFEELPTFEKGLNKMKQKKGSVTYQGVEATKFNQAMVFLKSHHAVYVENGLRQGCCMVAFLFNLYTCLAVERWLERVKDVEGVGMTMQYKLDKKQFRRYTRNVSERRVTRCQFADDGALLASARPAAEKAALMYQQTSRNFGLTISRPKTKHMVTDRMVEEEDLAPIVLDGGEVDAVNEFPYLGCVVDSSGRLLYMKR